MARILTGIQSTGVPHLGNLLGALEPGVKLSEQKDNTAIFFIADLHSLTSLKDTAARVENIKSVAAAWLACGFDTNQGILFRQSEVPEVCELTWYLSCFAPFPMLANAHSFKDKSAKQGLSEVNAGLFTYPVLMAADILLYDTDIVPVGKDQIQHIEITRDIASSINHQHGEIFILPKAQVEEQVKVVPGIDGQKMSKSYGNTINVFEEEKKLKKSINRIITGSEPLEAPKNPDNCTVFQLYSLLADTSEINTLRNAYQEGNFGYGAAKQILFEKIMEKYEVPRQKYMTFMQNPESIETALRLGQDKARAYATSVLDRVRGALGFGSII
jgi:tryptophanyl-tRNA synthetase